MAKSEISIKLATSNDIPAVIVLLERQLVEHDLGISSERIRDAIEGVISDRSRGFLLVANVHDITIGVAYVSFVWSIEHGGSAAWLEEMYVIPEWRNRGAGLALLRETLKQCKEAGCQAIDLEIAAAHEAAGRLYARMGFLPLDRSRWVKFLKDK